MKVIDFIGEKAQYDPDGQFVWGVDKNDGLQKIADLRGWGAIQNLFKLPGGFVDHEKAAEFQDKVGEWIVKAINEKLQKERDNFSTEIQGKNVSQSCYREVWQKWCELDNGEFDKWLHGKMNE
jgi:hypothetical protein